MFRIFVCDDDANFHQKIGAILQEHLRKVVKQFEILYFSSPYELLEANYENCDVFCLDDLWGNDMNGFELAKKLRQKNSKAYIIFISSYIEIAYAAFEVGTFRYLLKPVCREQLVSAFDIILRERRERLSKLITLQQGQRYIRIPYMEIIYFETVDRKLHAVTTNKEYMLDNKINDLEQQVMDINFFRIHKSYLVNLAYVKEYDLSSVTMLNGDILFMSRLRCKEFKDNYRRYLKDECVKA